MKHSRLVKDNWEEIWIRMCLLHPEQAEQKICDAEQLQIKQGQDDTQNNSRDSNVSACNFFSRSLSGISGEQFS